MNSITPSPSSLHHSNFSSPNPSQFPLKPPKTLHFFYNPTTSLHSQTQTPLLLSRRLFLPSVSGIWDALTGNNNNDPARQAVVAIRRGMHLFREGDVSGSVMEFDRAIELDPRQKAYLWQRGLSLYYLDRFEEAAEQFRIDVAQNPNDTEESIWCFLCEAQLYGVDEARRRFLEVGRDPRPVMREAYATFKDGGDPEKLVSVFSNGNDSEFFYASLYAGLYYESQRNAEGAEHHIVAASQSSYAVRSNDYMASLAKVHCSCRNWRPKDQP
ncbi:hypothetical protein Syun_028744 [Stephania yunnanensis]|uniref:Uncharacterized protein n=1 Tax=Stephania yunnanensis TaxID=152371 RepID=A0AAP0E447_9MAGN